MTDNGSILPPSLSIPCPCPNLSTSCTSPCCTTLGGTCPQVKIHITLFLLLLIEFLASLRFIKEFPLFSVLVLLLYGPILWVTTIIHELSHLWVSRCLLFGGRRTNVRGEQFRGDESGGGNRRNDDDERDGQGEESLNQTQQYSSFAQDIILWPLGGYTLTDSMSSIDVNGPTALNPSLLDDLKIAIAGPLTHIPMSLFWVALYAAINNGELTSFSFRMYLTVLSSGATGFFSTLFEQSCLINILILWFNIFVPMYPLDGARIMTSCMILRGMKLAKVALLSFLISILVSLALFAWSMASFVDGVGTTGLFSLLIAISTMGNSCKLYGLLMNGRLREHPLFGRDCYIDRLGRPQSLEMAGTARNTPENSTVGVPSDQSLSDESNHVTDLDDE